MKRFLFSVLALLLILSACNQNYTTPTATDDRELFATPTSTKTFMPPLPTPSPASSSTPVPSPTLRRGINFGNMLEAPNEGEWGLTVQEEYFDLVKEAGFDFVRLPVRWNTHAGQVAPYAIDPDFFARIDLIVNWALERDLAIIVDFHHYTELMSDPTGHKDRYLGITRQVAEHYKDYPSNVLFELLNEPNDKLDAGLWNQYLREALVVVRRSNPTRDVVIGPASWNAYDSLPTLEVPDDDHLIVTFHYYLPFQFTHQGAEWAGDEAQKWLGTTWDGTDAQEAEIAGHFESVADWAKQHGNVRILLGEFGAYNRAPQDSRVRWTEFMRSEAERHRFAWAYWEFGAGFGAYDPSVGAWRNDLLRALIP
jgi:endoglucanase